MEIFKDIKGYPGYQISTNGRIWNAKTQRYLKPSPNNGGYMQINMFAINGKRKKELVHRLVALAFIPNPNHYPEVNHIDSDRSNNILENLEWVDRKTNMEKSSLPQNISVFNKRTHELIGEYLSIKQACEALDLTESNVSACLSDKCKQKTHKGYYFKKNIL